MQTEAVLLTAPKAIEVRSLRIAEPGERDLVIDIKHSAISTGTEKLLWSGDMPDFPGMGYPLVPGYEATGEVVEAGRATAFKPGDHVFVPGANTYLDARGLFGAAASRIVTDAGRVVKVDAGLGPRGALLALAATAHHAVCLSDVPPELVVGHGTLGRLMARITTARGARPPKVWEIEPLRQSGAQGYDVIDPASDERRDYRRIIDASGDTSALDGLIARLARGGETTLAGFYSQPVAFAFPPAFMREAHLRIASEWTPEDLIAARDLIESGALSLDGLITHTAAASDAPDAYVRAFEDPTCLKMTLDWTETR